MANYKKALGWAAVILLIAAGSRAGVFGEDLANTLTIASIALWVTTGAPRNCSVRMPTGI